MPNRSDIETDVEKYLKKRVAEYGGLTEKHVCVGVRGAPDQLVTWQIGYAQSRTDRVETKAPLGRLKSWQTRYHAKLRNVGISVWVCYTKDDVDSYILWARTQ
jgi:hypothetical protein